MLRRSNAARARSAAVGAYAPEAIEQSSTRAAERVGVEDAAAWLEDYLTTQGGSAKVKPVLAAGQAAFHGRSSLYRAKDKLALVSDYDGFPREACWRLPSSSRPGTPENAGTPETVSTPDPQSSSCLSCPGPTPPKGR